ncbi:MAG: cation transporter [Lachnospiraceae bacterium]|nr:cation transporter [Lachnospiraceae bacterium]
MGNIIVIAILAVVIVFALRSSKKHMKGQGGCCGGSEDIHIEQEKKKLDGPVIATRIMHIEGMHCEHCKDTVERAIGRIQGAAAEVDLGRKIAVVSLDRPVPDDQLITAVTLMDYKVTSVE